jgi:L-ribulose-5-phosphate 3-epimerase
MMKQTPSSFISIGDCIVKAADRSNFLIGMNVRVPPFSSRSAVEEIAFARSAGFDSVQFAVRDPGEYAPRLGASLETLGQALHTANLVSVMEIVVRIDQAGRNDLGQTPLEALQVNLPVILALNCACVHWHLVPLDRSLETDALFALEESFAPQFTAGVALATSHGFRLGFEHNEPALGLFATPERCASMLDEVPGLGFVWDFNHTIPEHLEGFLQLTPRMTMLHVSDTPLPAVNHHLPLGKGRIDFSHYCRELLEHGYSGPAILEIGGLPQSGGYGQDTDEALLDSRERLTAAI